MASFSASELERYDRHFKLSVLGTEGQLRLRAARVLCLGVGGLGAPACLYLAAAGVGALGLVDDDIVELSNLQRQILYRSTDIGQQKTRVAQNQLSALNPDIQIITHPERLTVDNAEAVVGAYDIIMDCSDNFTTHYLLNDVCHALRKPLIFAAIAETEGRCSVFNAIGGPCYRCLFPEPPTHASGNCSEMGVLGVLPGLLGIIQATEVIKWAAKIGEPLVGRVLCVDMLSLRFREFCLEKSNDCPLCSGLDYSQPYCFTEDFSTMNNITVEELQDLLVECPDDTCVLDVREPDEYALYNIGGQLIPLAQLPNRLAEVDKTKHIVVHCKLGGRSAKASQLLTEAGFPRVSNLTGGIMAWIDQQKL